MDSTSSVIGIQYVTNNDTYLEVLGIITILANIVVVLSPLPSLVVTYRQKVSRAQIVYILAPHCSIFWQYYLWAVYGFYAGEVGLCYTNAVGAGISLAYLAFAALCARPRETAVPIVVGSCVVLAVFTLGVVMLSRAEGRDRERAFAYAAMVGTMLLALAPLPQAIQVAIEKRLGAFPVTLVVASFTASACWVQYATIVGDNYIMFPNIFGVVAGAMQIAIAVWVAVVERWGHPEARSLVQRSKALSTHRENRGVISTWTWVWWSTTFGGDGEIGPLVPDPAPTRAPSSVRDATARNWSSNSCSGRSSGEEDTGVVPKIPPTRTPFGRSVGDEQDSADGESDSGIARPPFPQRVLDGIGASWTVGSDSDSMQLRRPLDSTL